MNNNFKPLDREDVVSVYSDQIFVNNRTFTVDEFTAAIMQMYKQKIGELTDIAFLTLMRYTKFQFGRGF